MKKEILQNIVAIVVIFGHIAIFSSAMALGVLSMLGGSDALQTILMASPILSATALAAFSHIMEGGNLDSESRVSKTYATLAIIMPALLLFVIGCLFYLFWLEMDGFGPDQLKITLGAVETFFGVYLGAISRSLFGRTPSTKKTRR